jgi:hypothetical protein
MHLPQHLGGYGLAPFEDLCENLIKAPLPHQWLICKACSEGITYRDLVPEMRALRKLNTAPVARGIASITKIRDELLLFLEENAQTLGLRSWADICSDYKTDSNPKRTLANARAAGWYSLPEFVKLVLRGNVFQELLLGREAPTLFRTVRYVELYHELWSEFERLGTNKYYERDLLVHGPEALGELLATIMIPGVVNLLSEGHLQFLDINETTTIDVGHWDGNEETETFDFLDVKFSDVYTFAMPTLVAGLRFLGLHS